MFLNHDAAFTTFAPAMTPAAPQYTATFSAQTRVETRSGWASVDTLCAGDAVATLDGGFAEITAISHPKRATPLVHVPGGVLSTCSDVALPADTHVALTPPARWSDAPVVSVPLRALSGSRPCHTAPGGRGEDLCPIRAADPRAGHGRAILLPHPGIW